MIGGIPTFFWDIYGCITKAADAMAIRILFEGSCLEFLASGQLPILSEVLDLNLVIRLRKKIFIRVLILSA